MATRKTPAKVASPGNPFKTLARRADLLIDQYLSQADSLADPHAKVKTSPLEVLKLGATILALHQEIYYVFEIVQMGVKLYTAENRGVAVLQLAEAKLTIRKRPWSDAHRLARD